MIDIKEKEQCCGCFACDNICPVQCIKMMKDEEGFLYPQVDKEVCINCGKCENVCPINNACLSKDEKIKEFRYEAVGYVVQHCDSVIRKESTSGGAFTALAETIIDKNHGVVFGAAFDKDMVVKHTYVEHKEDLRLFRSSKYVQSEIGDAYTKARDFLDNGRFVLFSGTPCHIEGFYNFINKNYSNLCTVSVVCRAVPSPEFFKKYTDFQSKNLGRIKKVVFRDKKYGYSYSTMSVYYTKDSVDKEYHRGIESDPYLRAFFSGLSVRPSCNFCKFRNYKRSDIVIWDCFNVSNICKDFDDNGGTTRLVLNSKQGVELFGLVGERWKSVAVPVEKMQSKKERAYEENILVDRKVFYHDMNELDVQTFFGKYFPDTLTIKFLRYGRIICYRTGIYGVVKRLWDLIKNR